MRIKRRRLVSIALSSCLLAISVDVCGQSGTPMTISTVLVNSANNTSVLGSVIIASTGSLQMTSTAVNSGNALYVDSPSATVTLNAGNTIACPAPYTGSGCAIATSGGASGINITTVGTGVGSSATVTVNSGANIFAQTNGINVDSTLATISNSGIIQGNTSAIALTGNGQGANITNTGTLQNNSTLPGVAAVVQVGGTSLTLLNSGTIQALSTAPLQDGIQTTVDFTSITNSGSGNISTNGGTGALEIAGTATGSVTNNGTITNTAGGTGTGALTVNGNFSGAISNTGVIQTTSSAGNSAVLLNNNFGSFTNSGTIRATMLGGSAVDFEASTISGSFSNAGGTMTAVDSPVALIAQTSPSSFTQLSNSGTMQTTSTSGVISNTVNNASISGGIVNYGNIINLGLGPAIQLTANNSSISVIQNGGLISGNILLAAFNSNGLPGFAMNGGAINGNVSAQSIQQNTMTLTGGNLNGTLTLGGLGDTVNLGGTAFVQSIRGGASNDIFNISGGNFGSLLETSGANVINGIGTATITGTISGVQTINVTNPGGVFTTTGAINGVSNLVTVNANSTYTINGALTGTGSFNTLATGTLNMGSNANVSLTSGTNAGTLGLGAKTNASGPSPTNFNGTLSGNFTQTSTGVLQPTINSATSFGALYVTGTATINPNSFIEPVLGGGGFITNGSVYTIVQALGGVSNLPTVIQPASLTVQFYDQFGTPGNQKLQLVAARSPYSNYIVNDQNAFNIAQVLDEFAFGAVPLDPSLSAVMAQLDLIDNAQNLTVAIDQLGPSINYAMVDGSNIIMTRTFNSIQRRLDQVKGVKSVWGEHYEIRRYDEGYGYGDCDPVDEGVYVGTWVMLLGEYLTQQHIANLHGYTGNGQSGLAQLRQHWPFSSTCP